MKKWCGCNPPGFVLIIRCLFLIIVLDFETIVIMTRIKLDLHHIYKDSRAIDDALQQAFDEAIKKKIRVVEILSGKNSGQLLNKIERFLQQPHIKKQYQRMEKDSNNSGRLFLYFKY